MSHDLSGMLSFAMPGEGMTVTCGWQTPSPTLGRKNRLADHQVTISSQEGDHAEVFHALVLSGRSEV